MKRTAGLKAREIANVAKNRGIIVGGKTSLHHRVYHELYRMVRLNRLRKTASGGYVFVDDNGNAPVAPLKEASAPSEELMTGTGQAVNAPNRSSSRQFITRIFSTLFFLPPANRHRSNKMETSRRRRRRDREPDEPAADISPIVLAVIDPTHDDIARRACALYQQRGGQHGEDWDDWFRAERELRRSNMGAADVAA